MGATLTFGGTTSDYLTAASQAKYGTLTGMAVLARVKGTFFTNVPAYNYTSLLSLPDRSITVDLYHDGDGTPTLRMFVFFDFYGQTMSVGLPATYNAANDYIVYIQQFPSQVPTVAIFESDGTLKIETSGTDVRPALTNAASGNGTLRIGSSATRARAFTLDAIAVLNAARSGAARATKPVVGDSDVLGLYYLDEGTGTTTADETGGTALTLTGTVSWNNPDGAWDTASSTFFRPYFITG